MAFDFSDLTFEEGETAPEAIVNGNGSTDLVYLDELRRASRPVIEAIARGLSGQLGLHSEISEKSQRSTLDKCARPTLKARCPWFTPAHIRDYLRFRTYLNGRDDFADVLNVFRGLAERRVISIVKIDTAKLFQPGVFGWRMVATDLRIRETGLIVEHYMASGDMIAINEVWLHKVYERWRSIDTDALRLSDLRSFERDTRFSRSAYLECFVHGLVAGSSGLDFVPKSRSALADMAIASLRDALSPP